MSIIVSGFVHIVPDLPEWPPTQIHDKHLSKDSLTVLLLSPTKAHFSPTPFLLSIPSSILYSFFLYTLLFWRHIWTALLRVIVLLPLGSVPGLQCYRWTALWWCNGVCNGRCCRLTCNTRVSNDGDKGRYTHYPSRQCVAASVLRCPAGHTVTHTHVL